MNQHTKQTKRGINPLPVLAGVVVLAAAAVLVFPKLSQKESGGASAEAALPTGSDLVIQTEETYTQQDGTLTIPAAFLEENAPRFTRWKQF